MKLQAVLVAAGLVLAAAPAFAQDETPPSPPPPSGGTPAPAPATEAVWNDINERPLVTPMGKLELHASLPILALRTTTPTGTTTDTAEFLGFGATYGVADKLEIGGDYVFLLHPNGDIGTGILGLHGAYAAYTTGKLDLALAGSLAIGTGGNNDVVLQLGAWARYHIAPKISLFTGQPALPLALGGFSSFLAPPVPFQLQIGLNNNQPAELNLPIGVGFQASPQLFLFAETVLAEIFLSDGPRNQSAFVFGADFVPLGLGAWFTATNKLDIGVTFADELKNAGDFYVITLAGRYYLK